MSIGWVGIEETDMALSDQNTLCALVEVLMDPIRAMMTKLEFRRLF